MAETCFEILLNQGLIDQECKKQLQKGLSQNGHDKILNYILQSLCGNDVQSQKEFMVKMWEKPSIKKLFYPGLYQLVLRNRLSDIFGADINNPELMQCMEKQIREHLKDYDMMIKNIYQQLMGEEISNEQLKEIINDLTILRQQESELQQTLEQEKNKLLEVKENFSNEQVLLESQIKSCKEYLENLQQDAENMPKNIIQFQFTKTEIQLCQEFIKLRTQKLSENMKYTMQMLKKLESFQTGDSEAKMAITEILKQEDIRRNMKVLKQKICGINVNQVFRMLKKGRQLESDQSKIKKKGKKIRVIMFIGLSKAGKTTIITRLMGYQMRKMKINGITTIQPKNLQSMKQEHKELIIGYENKSTTRYPKLYEIKTEQQDDEFITFGMDCAGFQDAAGTQVQISNRITTIEALRKVDELQIAIVINEKNWGTRGQDIEKLASTVSGIIKDYKKVKAAISFVFNQFSQDFKETFHSNVGNLYKNILELSGNVVNENFKQFFKHLKEVSKAPKKMFCVDPETLKPQQFLSYVSVQKTKIENPVGCLISDIGAKPKQQIKKYCKRCTKQFNNCYEKGDMEGAHYYLKMLELVASQPKLESSADRQIQNMKEAIEKDLTVKIQALKIDFEQLQAVFIRDSAHREKKLENMKQKFNHLKKESKCFQTFNQQSNLSKRLDEILHQTGRWYLAQMEKWKNEDNFNIIEINNTTISALEFCKKFSYSQNNIKAKLNGILMEFKKIIQNEYENFQLKNQIKKYFDRYLSLCSALELPQNIILQKEIQIRYEDLRKNMSLINLQKAVNKQAEGDLIRPSISEELDIKAVTVLLKFIDVILSYPKQMIKNVEQNAKQTSRAIIIRAPEEVMSKFDQLLQFSKRDQDQDKQVELQGLVNAQSENNINQTIKKIHNLIKWLKILNNIEVIKNYHDNKLIQKFQGLKHIIQKEMRSVEKIKEAFSQNDVNVFKKDIKKMRLQIKKLENLVKVADNKILADKFQDLKEELDDSFGAFVAANQSSENFTFNSSQKQIKNLFIKCQKLYEFKQIYKVIGLQSKQSNLKQRIQKIIKSNQKKVLGPIQKYETQIAARNSIQCAKLLNYLKYIDYIRENEGSKLFSAISSLLCSLETKIKQRIMSIYLNSIENPLKELTSTLGRQMMLEDDNLLNIENFLKSDTSEKARKALFSISQIKDKPKLTQSFFNDLEDIKSQWHNDLEDFKNRIQDKISSTKINYYTLEKLQTITFKLKNIQFDQKMFDNLHNQIRGKIKQHTNKEDQIIESFKNSCTNIKNFDEQTFKELYFKYFNCKNQTQLKNKQALQNIFGNYKHWVKRNLQELEAEIIDDEELGDKIIQILKVIEKFCKNVQSIKEKLPDNKIFNEKSQLKYIDQLLIQISKKVVYFCQKTEQKLFETQVNEIKRITKLIKQIDTSIIYIQKCRPKLILDEFQKFKAEKNIKYLSDFVSKKAQQKVQKISDFKKGKVILNELNENFLQFYNSLDKKQQQQILKSLEAQINTIINQIQAKSKQNYQNYENQCKKLSEYMNIIPNEISQPCLLKLKKINDDLNKQQKQICQQFLNHQQFSLGIIIPFAKQCKKSNHQKAIQNIVQSVKQKSRKDNTINGSRYLDILQNELWNRKQELQGLPEILEQVKKIQSKICRKLSKDVERSWKIIKEDYLQENAQCSYSDNSQEDIFSVKMTGNSKKNTENICLLYDCLKQAIDGNKILSINNLQLFSQQLKVIENEMKKFMTLVQDGIHQFRQVIKNPKNSNKISHIFSGIVMIERDLQFFATAKSKYFKMIYESKTFKQPQKRISELKLQLTAIVNGLISSRFSFYDDEIRTMSAQKLEQKIQKYEQGLDILSILERQYNIYLSPKKQIKVQQIKSNLKSQISKAIQQFQKSLKQCFHDRDLDQIDERVNTIQKLFHIVKSKQRNYLIDFDSYCEKFKQLRREALKPESAKLEGKVKQLIDISKSMNQKIQQFKACQDKKIQKSQQQIDKQEKLINNIQKKYKDLLQNQQDQKEKQKLQRQKEGQIKNIKNTYLKAEQVGRDKRRQALNRFIKSLQKEYGFEIDQVCKQLIFLKKISFINEMASEIESLINTQMKKIQKWSEPFNKIYKCLNDQSNYYAGMIIDDCPSFKKFKARQFTQDTNKTNSAAYILGQMLKKGSINSQQKDILERYFQIFNEEQNKHLNDYKNTKDKEIIHSLIVKITIEADDIRKILQNSQSQETIGDAKRIRLLAKIFALWSISSILSEESENQDQVQISYQAHAAQIICILIVLSMDNSNDRQVIRQNRLAEVKTGEGKSIVLAALSIYFALFGYEVHCACYSPILSKRDQKDFQQLFQQCGVKSQISYGVFEQIIKKVLNQTDNQSKLNQTFQNVIKEVLTSNVEGQGLFGWVKQKFMGKIMNFFGSQKQSRTKLKKILIIDEIDVLFDKNYFGDTFNQSIDLRDETIVELFKFIWVNKDIIRVDIIQKSQQFQNVLKRFPALKNVLINQVNGMILALQTYQDQKYTIQDKKIMYKVQDTLMDISYRYNTVYAYLHQFEKNKVSQAAFIEHMTINLCVAQFSYSCLPQYYDYVVGVTGTLTCLPQYIKGYLDKKYKIGRKQMFSIPSVYGSSTQNRIIREPTCVTQQNLKAQVINKINIQFDKNRPILVFFRNKNELHDMFTSQQYKELQKYTSCITQEHDEIQRNTRIRNCSFKSTITFMTNVFIRGTDFKLQNKNAIKLGGFHAIVTYLIGSQADWIQATGRVARQGKPGSIEEVYSQEQFEILGIDKNTPNRVSQVPKARRVNPEKQKDNCEERLSISQIRHNQTISLFNPQKFNQKSLAQYVYSKNKFPEAQSGKTARMCIVMDKTISMDTCDSKLKACLPQIFDDIDETLTQKKFKGCLEMQIIFYRNYNSPLNELLEFSTFQVQSLGLKNFVSRSSVNGGWVNQAVQVALQHINKLSDVQQVIIFGDAPGNTEQDIILKRRKYKHLEEQRLQAGLAYTNTEIELQQIIRKQIKIHSFYLNRLKDVQKYFKHISHATNGQAQHLDLYQKDSANKITAFIVQRALKLIGGHKGADALLSQYKEILSRRMRR